MTDDDDIYALTGLSNVRRIPQDFQEFPPLQPSYLKIRFFFIARLKGGGFGFGPRFKFCFRGVVGDHVVVNRALFHSIMWNSGLPDAFLDLLSQKTYLMWLIHKDSGH